MVIYDLFCNTNPDDDRIQILWVDGNETTCNYNIKIRSKWSCAQIIEPQPKENVIEDLSGGSIVLIIASLVFFIYIICGCGYQGLVNGRVGFDAMPNKRMWHQMFRYTIAGCITTKETICFCGAIPTKYQEL